MWWKHVRIKSVALRILQLFYESVESADYCLSNKFNSIRSTNLNRSMAYDFVYSRRNLNLHATCFVLVSMTFLWPFFVCLWRIFQGYWIVNRFFSEKEWYIYLSFLCNLHYVELKYLFLLGFVSVYLHCCTFK